MRVFEIAPGGHTPKHAHDWEHEMFVHSGAGEVYGNGQWQPMNAGKVLFIPANEEHQMRNTGKDLLVVVCLVPAQGAGVVRAPPGHWEGKDPNPSRLPITPGIPISHEGYVQSHDQAAHQGPGRKHHKVG